MKVKKWEIYLYSLQVENKGSIQYGRRPIVILQTNRINRFSTTAIVAPITSVIKKEEYSTHVIIGTECGLNKTSMIELEQMCAIDINHQLGACIGKIIDPIKKIEINRGLDYIFNKSSSGSIEILCNSCLNKVKESNEYFVRRIDIFDKAKQRCELCGKDFGHYYAVVKKELNYVN